MLRVLQQFLLTTLLVVFASQASAMFIQSDWLNPTEPGVGTNRYSYSFNDPINLSDPGGNDIDDDPGEHSTNPSEHNRVVGQTGQAVDEARERARLEAGINQTAQDLFGQPVSELGPLGAAISTMVTAAEEGFLGPAAQMAASDPTSTSHTPTRAGTLARGVTEAVSRVKRGKVVEPPTLDPTGKVHGELPTQSQLSQFSRSQLSSFRSDLQTSVKTRAQENADLGPDQGHMNRLAQERGLIRSIDKILGD